MSEDAATPQSLDPGDLDAGGQGPVLRLLGVMLAQRALLANAGSLFGATLLTAAIGGLYWALAARVFPPAAVGLAAAAISAMTLIAQLSTFGLGTVLMGELSQHRGSERVLIDSALGSSALVGAALAGAFMLVAAWFVPALGQLQVPLGFALFALGVAATSAGLVLDQALLGLLRGSLQLVRNGLASIVKLLVLVAVAIAVADRSQGLALFFTWITGSVVSMVVLLALPRRDAGSGRPVWQVMAGVAALAVRHHLLNLAILAPGLLLPLVITGALSAEANAFFYIAYLIAGFAWAIPAALSTAVYAAGARDLASLVRRVRFAFWLSAATGIAFNVVLLVAARPVLSVFGPAYADQATGLLQLFGLGIFPITLNSLYVPIARVERRFLEGAALMVVSMVIELGVVIAGARLGGLGGSGVGWLIGVTVSILPFVPTLIRVGLRGEVRPVSRDRLGVVPVGVRPPRAAPPSPAASELEPAAALPVSAAALSEVTASEALPVVSVPEAGTAIEPASQAATVRATAGPVSSIVLVTDGPALLGWQASTIRSLDAAGVRTAAWLHLGQVRAGAWAPSNSLAAVPPGQLPAGLPAPVLAEGGPAAPPLPAVDAVLDLTSTGAPSTIATIAPERWRFEYGPERGPDPVNVALRDVVRGTGTTEVRLVSVGSGTVLRAGLLRTTGWSLRQQLDQMLMDPAAWPAQAAILRGSATGSGVAGGERRGIAGKGPDATLPSTDRSSPALLRVGLAGRRALAARGLLVDHSDWAIGLVDAPIASFLDPAAGPDIRWLPPQPGRYAADPFGIQRGSDLHVFFEDYDQRGGRGVISHVVVDADGTTGDVAPVVVPDGHASYPYLLESGGEVWMIPETADAREVRLYRAVDFPRQWGLEAVLLRDMPVSDPTIIERDGVWWLFGTSRGRGLDHALRLWHAPALTGPWTLHRLDPVKIDVRSARPAGTPFVVDGTLYRPAQDSSRRYGGRVTINRVEVLTPDDFEEQAVRSIDPPAGSGYPDGLHTLSAVGRRTLVDGNRVHFVPAALRHEIGRRVGSFAPRPRA